MGLPKTHGLSRTPEGKPTYNSWNMMKARCNCPTAPNYARYGGRGIKVCARWAKFENFLADMGFRPAGKTLDRINVNGPYSPENCRWATPKEQQRNARTTRFITFEGETKSLQEWAEIYQVNADMVVYRLKRGYSVKEALTAKKFSIYQQTNSVRLRGA